MKCSLGRVVPFSKHEAMKALRGQHVETPLPLNSWKREKVLMSF
jgi:hypothetical protein